MVRSTINNARGMTIAKRLAALERAHPSSMPRWHCLRRYEGETDEQARAAYEAEHGPIGRNNVIMRVIISKPGERPSAST